MVEISEQRVLCDEPDILFIDNVNFFVKSYLISVCSFLHWRLATGIKDKHLNYSDISLPVTKKDIANEISANPYRTLKLFQLLGIDLAKKENFESNKDLINTIVTKRNNIVHHNDTAADVSFGDLKAYIDVIVPYMAAVKEAVDEAAA